MSEAGWILKCYSCKIFQVQLKKKAKRWQCKVCGKKQDLMQIFFKGSTKDCRLNVQNLNKAEGEKLEELEKLREEALAQEYDDYEQEMQNSVTDFYRNDDEFSEDALAEFDPQSKQDENNFISDAFESYEEENSISEGYRNYEEENNFISEECTIEDRYRSVPNRFNGNMEIDNEVKLETNYESDKIDFGYKEKIFEENSNKLKTEISNQTILKKDENIKLDKPKLSIFESNNDFDDSLDF